MLQSSAAVHGGNSGGMMLNADGVVLGMVTSNVRHTPPPNSDDDAATKKAKEQENAEGGALLVSPATLCLSHLIWRQTLLTTIPDT